MTAAILILSAFAGLWAIGGLLALGLPSWMCGVPVLLAAGVAIGCLRAARSRPSRPEAERRRIKRLVLIWSAAEVALLIFVANVLAATGLRRYTVPAAAIVVGLHFIPLARGIPQTAYYAAGSALIVLGLAAAAFPVAVVWPVTGFGAALILWVTSIAISVPREIGESK